MTRPPHRRPSLTALPAEVLAAHVLPHLPLSALGRVANTCRTLLEAVLNEDAPWHDVTLPATAVAPYLLRSYPRRARSVRRGYLRTVAPLLP